MSATVLKQSVHETIRNTDEISAELVTILHNFVMHSHLGHLRGYDWLGM
jgi:hypothetical protein